MGIIKGSIWLTLVLILICNTAGAQELPQVHKINGKKYYLHVVEPGHTLYGISKLYNVSIDDLKHENPVVRDEGLKVNQTLLIPVTGDNKKSLGGVVEQSAEFITHEAQAKETLYSISKRYAVSLETLLNANPGIKERGLKVGDRVMIPVAKVAVSQSENVQLAQADSLEAHIVKKGETLYAISKKYGVKVTDLIKANPGLTYELKEGMAIRIPGLMAEIQEPETLPVDTIQDSIVVHRPDTTGKPVAFCMLLPLKPVFPDSASIKGFKIDEAQRVAISFYRGMVHAVDSLALKHHVRFDIEVIASGQDTADINALIQSGALDGFDIVVGPFYTDQFELVADYLKPTGVPIICPIPKPSKILFQRHNAIKTTPSESMQLDAIAEFLAASYRDSTVVLVNSNKFQDQDLIEFFKSRYGIALGVPDTFIADAIREIKLWDINRETLTMRMRDTGRYTLVVPSKDKVFVTRLLGELYNLQYGSGGNYHFRVIGLEDWERYSTDLDIQHLHALNVTLPLTNHIDFGDYRVKRYYTLYNKRFGYDPDKYTLLGFDLGAYLVSQMAFNKKEWFEHPENFQFNGMLMDYHFHRVLPESGIENQSVELFEYDHFRLKSFARWPLQEMK